MGLSNTTRFTGTGVTFAHKNVTQGGGVSRAKWQARCGQWKKENTLHILSARTRFIFAFLRCIVWQRMPPEIRVSVYEGAKLQTHMQNMSALQLS